MADMYEIAQLETYYDRPTTPVRNLIASCIDFNISHCDEKGKPFQKVIVDIDDPKNTKGDQEHFEGVTFTISNVDIALPYEQLYEMTMFIPELHDGPLDQIDRLSLALFEVFSLAENYEAVAVFDNEAVIATAENLRRDYMTTFNHTKTSKPDSFSVRFTVPYVYANEVLEDIDAQFLDYVDDDAVSVSINGKTKASSSYRHRHPLHYGEVDFSLPTRIDKSEGDDSLTVTVVDRCGLPFDYTIDHLRLRLEKSDFAHIASYLLFSNDPSLLDVQPLNPVDKTARLLQSCSRIVLHLDISEYCENVIIEDIPTSKEVDHYILNTMADFSRRKMISIYNAVRNSHDADSFNRDLISSGEDYDKLFNLMVTYLAAGINQDQLRSGVYYDSITFALRRENPEVLIIDEPIDENTPLSIRNAYSYFYAPEGKENSQIQKEITHLLRDVQLIVNSTVVDTMKVQDLQIIYPLVPKFVDEEIGLSQGNEHFDFIEFIQLIFGLNPVYLSHLKNQVSRFQNKLVANKEKQALSTAHTCPYAVYVLDKQGVECHTFTKAGKLADAMLQGELEDLDTYIVVEVAGIYEEDRLEDIFNREYNADVELTAQDVEEMLEVLGNTTAILFVYEETARGALEHILKKQDPYGLKGITILGHKKAGGGLNPNALISTFSGIGIKDIQGESEEEKKQSLINSYKLQLFIDENSPIFDKKIPLGYLARSADEYAKRVVETYHYRSTMLDAAKGYINGIDKYRELLNDSLLNSEEERIEQFLVENLTLDIEPAEGITLSDLVKKEYLHLVESATRTLYYNLEDKGIEFLPLEFVNPEDEDYGFDPTMIHLNEETSRAVDSILEMVLSIKRKQEEIVRRFRG